MRRYRRSDPPLNHHERSKLSGEIGFERGTRLEGMRALLEHERKAHAASLWDRIQVKVARALAPKHGR